MIYQIYGAAILMALGTIAALVIKMAMMLGWWR